MGDLIELSTKELLIKFGSGNHKPGSGSAAAFQGMLSAKLARTVIDLSLQRDLYKIHHPKLTQMALAIDERIYPSLVHYFQLDSEQFDRVIKLRRQRNEENDPIKKRAIKKELEDALLPATQTPIMIATLCAELGGFTLYLFEHGFKAARGDSGVALTNATATIAGCLSIINLNLLSLGHNAETSQISREAATLKAAYLNLSTKADERLASIEKEARRNLNFKKELQELASGQWIGKNLSYAEIEDLTRRLQNTLWKYHDEITRQPKPENAINVLRPEVVLTRILSYQYDEYETLGQHTVEGSLYEIAGIIDKPKRSVAVSMQFPKETRNFTAAHELGHAFLHRQPVLHRDKAIDGSGAGNTRDPIELQANKFATYFLMPKKIVEDLFGQLFFTKKFMINDDTVFALTNGSVSSFRKKCKNLRELTRILATAESYRNQSFNSLAAMFNVSVETMAIRLEELGLAEF